MIDKPVFHLQLPDPYSTQHGQEQGTRHNRLGMFERHTRHRHGKGLGGIPSPTHLLRLEQHQCRGEIEEIQHERQGDADRHHPAEINDGPDITDDQGTERYDGRNGRVEAGLRHVLHRAEDQRALVRRRSVLIQNPVADDEMDG